MSRMSEASDLSKGELRAIARTVELWDEIHNVLSAVEARPRGVLHIDTEIQPGHLGWIGHNENGDITFQPAAPEAADV